MTNNKPKLQQNTNIVAINRVTNECLIATGVNQIAKFLGVHRNTIANNLSQVSHYQCVKYELFSNVPRIKMARGNAKIGENVAHTSGNHTNSLSSNSKSIRELTYEPFFD